VLSYSPQGKVQHLEEATGKAAIHETHYIKLVVK